MPPRSLASAIGITIAICGCARWRAAHEAEAALRAYNDALVVAYRTNDPRGLEAVAGPQELRKLIALIDLKRGAHLALESRLERLDVLDVSLTGTDTATLRTRERWRYWDRALRPGMPAGRVFVAEMWMRWDVGSEGGRWRVLGGRTEQSEYLEPPGFRPGAAEGRSTGRR